ncbi:hypothetical protein L195_g019050 [Trifolium pratense]|uniref:DUF506 family protein n=2 Tax=Trifolium pratense TaxID=57577 RepID=A0A2K3MYH2_TRIPR|nr:uncharacterized protein LOC123902940 [Trifolium pratense]PNX95853.1 hypothetical protein L195_g019050 [Trifolium pratense]CAJ2627781.1 unnamed protein product [Trifolium pratense]
MPFMMKIQPIDFQLDEEITRVEPVKPVVKSRLKRLLERQFSGVLRISASEKIAGGGLEPHLCKEGFNIADDFEPSSVCLAKMVTNYIEENQSASASTKCGRNRCNCFNRNCEDSSDKESESLSGYSASEAYEILKGLVACKSTGERDLLTDTAKIVDKNKLCKRKDSFCRKIVAEALSSLGYDASVCKSRWEKSKSPSHPAGEYEYIDVMLGNERLIIDIDFKSEFEIARSTKSYKMILQNLPYIFVGKCDRLQSIVAIVSEAGKQSLKKKGMHVPPWRRVEYVKAKWLSTYTRITVHTQKEKVLKENCVTESSGEDEKTVVVEWKPPELKPKGSIAGVKVVTGLAVVFEDDNP